MIRASHRLAPQATKNYRFFGTRTHGLSSPVVAAAAAAGGALLLRGANLDDNEAKNKNIFHCSHSLIARCEETSSPEPEETERFHQCLEYHRSLLSEYKRDWEYTSTKSGAKSPATVSWPNNGVPDASAISMLECDLGYCTQSPNYRSDETYCENMQFKIASFYLLRGETKSQLERGIELVKDLAERGHADGMCLYGMMFMDGVVAKENGEEEEGDDSSEDVNGSSSSSSVTVPPISKSVVLEANPNLGVVWWRRTIDMHPKHAQSWYELAVALYTGEGVVENEMLAVKHFRRAANLGHTGAAYMLGDCLLDGVGVVERDRAEALEWLVVAGELGHRGARSRVMALLEHDASVDHGQFTDASRQSFKLKEGSADGILVESCKEAIEKSRSLRFPITEDESIKWIDDSKGKKIPVSIERRYTIGGGCRNPVVLERRRTVVQESRQA